MWLRFLVPLSAVLTLAACQREQAQPPPKPPPPPEQVPREFKEGEVKDLPQQCNPAQPASVSLSIQGRNNDAFRVIMTCGGQEVARCMAVVEGAGAGIGTDTCSDVKPAVAGPARCILGVGNGNSPAATAPAWGCLN